MRHRADIAIAALTLLSAQSAFRVPAQNAIPRPRTRTYFIAADPVTWDYLPGGRDEIAGRPYSDTAFFASAKPETQQY